MSDRASILNRIQNALRTSAVRPPEPSPKPVFPPIAPSGLISHLERELQALKADFHLSPDWNDAHAWLKQTADQHELRRVVTSPEVDAVEAGRNLNARTLTGDNDCGGHLADVDLGITTCDCVVARTGSVVLTPQSGFGRALSILPPAHLVVAHKSQVVTDLSDAYKLLQARHGRNWPSMITFITGPSRTADIEKILVLGAHGPKKLFVLLLDF